MAILSLAYAGWPSGTFLAVPPTEMFEKPGAERQRQVIFGQRNAPNEGCQHHILLLHINPPVWGRLQVHSDSSIATLQEFERLSPSPFLDSRQGVRCEPLARLHVHDRRQKSAFNEFSAVLFPKIYAKGADG
jgi:hypothetical protein